MLILIENQLVLCDTYSMLIGLDEVGRGAWAGPLVVGAVGLGQEIAGLTDSKKLSRSQREKLLAKVYDTAKFAGIGVAEAAEIDELGLSQAHFLAYQRAIAQCRGELEIIIDGNINYLPNLSNVVCVVKADQTVPCVSAASIIAKVYRDNLMAELAQKYPNYGFEQNVGYGTAKHIESLARHGAALIHRKSYKPIRDLNNG